REAADLWRQLLAAADVEGRDGVWAHPDLLPDASDLDNPAAFIDRVVGGGTSSFDDPIAQLEAMEAKEAAERAEHGTDDVSEDGDDHPDKGSSTP
ncbi:MAG: zinc-dependent metalloprotease, partial [Rhodococcus sp.]